MSQQEFFEKVLRTLERLEIPYMLSGSLGASAFGEPRMTNDLDVVVDMNIHHVDSLSGEFPATSFYLPHRATILEEIGRRGQFNILHVESGSKADLILRKDTEFARAEFQRRRKVPFTATFRAYTASPEDVILSKLSYYNMGRSEKHLKDIAGVLKVSGKAIDLEYVQRWVVKLHLGEAWRAVEAILRRPIS